MSFVIDASVAVKWFFAEPDFRRAMDLTKDAPLLAPALIQIEVASAITRRFRMDEITADEASSKLAQAREALKWPMLRITGNSRLLPRAEEIAMRLRHPRADCVYIANAEAKNTELLTADATLHKRAAAHFDFVKLL